MESFVNQEFTSAVVSLFHKLLELLWNQNLHDIVNHKILRKTNFCPYRVFGSRQKFLIQSSSEIFNSVRNFQ